MGRKRERCDRCGRVAVRYKAGDDVTSCGPEYLAWSCKKCLVWWVRQVPRRKAVKK